jgi:hypothetical protein
MKKHYKWDYEKQYIGGSDVAALILVGCKEHGIHTDVLHFGEDNSYNAYIVDELAIIPDRYKLVHEFSSWMKIYDDDSMVKKFEAEKSRYIVAVKWDV